MSNYLFELCVVHLVLMLAYWVFLRKERQYNLLRFYLIGALILALAIPLFKFPALFESERTISAVPAKVVAINSVAARPIDDSSFFSIELLVYLYIGVSLFFFYKFIAGILRVVYLRRKSTFVRSGDLYVYRILNGKASFSFFNWIFLGDAIDNDREYQVMLEHEKAHVSLGHTYDIIFLQLFKAALWWLPTMWLLNKEMRKIHEYQADAVALKSYSIDDYSSILISSTLKLNGLDLVSSFYDGLILKRLTAMKQQTKKVSPWKMGALLTLFGVLIVALACTEEQKSDVAQAEEKQKDIFVIVEQLPEPQGGINAFYAKIMNEIRYPEEALKNGIEGRVDVEFVVEKNGSVSDIKVIKGIGAGCDEEAVKAIRNAPSFKAGTQSGKPVRVRMVMPIEFKIDGGKSGNGAQGGLSVLEMQPIKEKFKVTATYNGGFWSGVVYDEEGEGLPGVNIIAEGTTSGTVSELDGSFKLKANESNNLHLSFVGYESVKLNSKEL